MSLEWDIELVEEYIDLDFVTKVIVDSLKLRACYLRTLLMGYVGVDGFLLLHVHDRL